MTAIKRTLLFLLIFFVVVLISVTVLLLTFDANRLKPLLERAAAQQGLQLTLAGDLSWRLWPSLGVELGQVTAVPSAQPQGPPLAEVGGAEVAVALRPLLSKQIQVQAISLRDTTLNLLVDQNGIGNWSTIGPKAEPAEQPEADSGSSPELSIERLTIANLNLTYRDQSSGADYSVAGLDLDAENVNLNGREFPLALALTIDGAELPPVAIDYRGPVQLDLDASTLKLSNATLDLASGNARGRVLLTTALNWAAGLAAEGVVELQPLAVKPWLQAFELPPPAVAGGETVALRLPFKVTGDRYTLSDARIGFDDVQLTGGADITAGEPLRVVSHWQGTDLNLDRYLPAADDSESAPAQPEAAVDPTPLPLELLRQLALDVSLQLDSLTANGLDFSKPVIAVKGENGRIDLTRLNTGLAGGTIAGEGRLDARGDAAKVDLQLDTRNLNLQTLLQQLADFDSLSGSADANFTVTSHGATDVALQDNLQVKATAQSREARLVPINLEQRFCEALAFLQGQSAPTHEWQKATELKPMTLEMVLSGKSLDLTSLRASLAHITAQAAGSFDIESGSFNVPFQLSLGDFAGSIPGCLPISDSWRKRALPIRCKGNIDDIGPTTCLPDREALTALAKAKVKAKVGDKVEEKRDEIEHKAGEKAREALKKKLGEEKAGETEKSLRGVLDRLR